MNKLIIIKIKFYSLHFILIRYQNQCSIIIQSNLVMLTQFCLTRCFTMILKEDTTVVQLQFFEIKHGQFREKKYALKI